MITITGMDTKAGRAAEAAYRAANRIALCTQCDAIGPAYGLCLCGAFLLPPLQKPVQIALPTWS